MDEFYEGKKVEEKLEAIKSNLSADDKEKFETELKELPKLSAKNFEKYTKIALQQVIPNYSEQENQARIMSMGGGTSKAQGEDGQKVDKATLDFLKNN